MGVSPSRYLGAWETPYCALPILNWISDLFGEQPGVFILLVCALHFLKATRCLIMQLAPKIDFRLWEISNCKLLCFQLLKSRKTTGWFMWIQQAWLLSCCILHFHYLISRYSLSWKVHYFTFAFLLTFALYFHILYQAICRDRRSTH